MEITGTIEAVNWAGKKSKVEIEFALDRAAVHQFIDWRGERLTFVIEPTASQLALPDPAELGSYMVDGTSFPIQADRMSISGHEIRELAGLPPEAPLWFVVGAEKGTELLDVLGLAALTTEYGVTEPTAMVELADGMRFVSRLGEPEDAAEPPEDGDGKLAAVAASDGVPASPNGRGRRAE